MFKYHQIIENPTRLRAMTGLPADEFMALVPIFQAAFETYMQHHTIDGRIRYSRRYIPYPNSPLPTIEDKLVFILTYLKQNAIQEVQGQLFDMNQSNVSKWTRLLHTVLNRALAAQNLLPVRDADALAQRLRDEPPPAANQPPLLSMMAQNGQ
jgi:hypothetical protein